MQVKLTYRDAQFTVKPGCTARHAIKQCGLSPEAVLAVKNGELITDDTLLKPGDEIRLVAVISGGQGR